MSPAKPATDPHGGPRPPRLLRVISGKARAEYLTSAYHPMATHERTSCHVSFVPEADMHVRYYHGAVIREVPFPVNE